MLLILLLVVLLLAVTPRWPYSRSLGSYYPSGGLGVVLVVVIALVLLGNLRL